MSPDELAGPQSPLPGDGRFRIDSKLCRFCIVAVIMLALGVPGS
jgi:hypothetical protein